jgi:hypothetical protein
MPAATARVPTLLPRRYMGQLCKHFEHKRPVTLGEADGTITFAMGICTLRADTDAIVMRVEATDDAGLVQLKDVVARHLVRFAFREPVAVDWVADGLPQSDGTFASPA